MLFFRCGLQEVVGDFFPSIPWLQILEQPGPPGNGCRHQASAGCVAGEHQGWDFAALCRHSSLPCASCCEAPSKQGHNNVQPATSNEHHRKMLNATARPNIFFFYGANSGQSCQCWSLSVTITTVFALWSSQWPSTLAPVFMTFYSRPKD